MQQTLRLQGFAAVRVGRAAVGSVPRRVGAVRQLLRLERPRPEFRQREQPQVQVPNADALSAVQSLTAR